MALRDPRARSAHHGQPRNPNPTGSRSHGDPTDQVGDVFHQLAKEQLVPQIANRTRNAISVDRREVFFYQRLQSGRRCSCWSSNETSPRADCPVCYNTGFAGGFYKYGTDLFLFDPSRQWFGVNVGLNPLVGVPPWFQLEEGRLSGYVEWDQTMLRGQYFGLDATYFDYRVGEGSVNLTMRLVGVDPGWVPFSEDALKERIQGGGRIRFRVTLTRQNAGASSPQFLQFWFRTLVNSADPPILLVDIPRRQESNILVEYGALATFDQIQFAFSDTIQKINLEDMIVRLFDMTRWKIIQQQPNDPLNILTSHDVQARKVFQHEAMYRFPL